MLFHQIIQPKKLFCRHLAGLTCALKNTASMLRGRLREFSGKAPPRPRKGAVVRGRSPRKFLEFKPQTTRRSNLALAGRRFNHIFISSLVV